MTSLWGSLAPAQPRGLFGSDDDWLLTRAINGLGFGPMTQATQAGRPNGYISNGPVRPNDYLAPVAETISPTMGAYGAGQMAAEGSRAIGQGDYAGGGAGLALGMAGMIPGAPKNGIRAFHGSPHDFDRFSLDKIGTGEGAQAYGHGLYFAESEGVARSYRDNLAGRDYTRDGQAFTPRNAAEQEVETALWASGGDLEKAVGELTQRRGFIDDPVWTQRYDDAIKAAEAMKAAGGYSTTPKGRMYEVRINADPEDFLDWDKPLIQQGDKVRNAVVAGVGEKAADPTFRRMFLDSGKGEGLLGALAGERYDKQAATQKLREAGIPGIRYLDQGSRTAGDGSRNYVVFDDKLIDILRKYGLFGSLGMGGASGLFGTGEQSQ